MVECVICEAEVQLPDDVMSGELVICDECGTELEVTCTEPYAVEEAPQEDEDWGE